MCEETKNYLWALQDILGHGATSQVYKAYHKSTGELVAAKVYQSSSSSRSAQGDGRPQQNRDYRPILDRELEILRSTDHENIVRYIALEPVISTDSPQATSDREALLIEYCNGGSLHNVLEQPENRFGLQEDDFMLVFRQLTNALHYLHTKNTIHRDIKPDNIMLSINTNGERTYKLADLGVARMINEGENVFTSLVGTEEYIHPDLYRAAVHDNKRDALRTAFQTRADFPFEVDLWSLGVTLYQCATGELPFQPFAGTRKDRTIMKRILDTKPPGCISGIEESTGGKIQWSKNLPESCRLSKDLKSRLEILLQRLLESDRNKLMTFRDYFTETDRIFHLMPIYYLNLKYFTLTCSYFDPAQTITALYDRLQGSSDVDRYEEYYCLFQNVPYPILKSNPMSIKAFCEQLPVPTSKGNPLVFYTFTPLKHDDPYSPAFLIPDIKPVRQYNDVAAACDWSKDAVGLFYNVKCQLLEYQQVLQTAQCSTTIMQQHLNAIEELKNILDQIDNTTNNSAMTTSSISMGSNNGRDSGSRKMSTNSDVPSIGFSHLYGAPTSPNEPSQSPGTVHRAVTQSPMQLVHQSMRIYLKSYIQTYDKLKRCEKDILAIINKEFNGQLGMVDDRQPLSNTLWSSSCTKIYSSWIQRADKYLKDLIDLNDSFRKDRLLSNYNRLQSDSHFRRRKNIEELVERCIQFAQDECYPNLIQVFTAYNDWIKQRAHLIQNYQAIQHTYEKQIADIVHNMDMLDDIRSVVHKNIRELSGTSSTPNETMSVLSAMPRLYPHVAADDDSASQLSHAQMYNEAQMSSCENEENDQKTLMMKFRGTTRKTIQQAEEGFNKLDSVIRQLRTNMHKK